jgi:chromosome segregation ATPase
MPSDRDIRHRHIPPPAVRAQIAAPKTEESWESWDAETPAMGTELDAKQAINKVNTRSKQVLAQTQQVLVSSRNTEDRVGQISAGFHALESRVGEISSQVSDLQRSTGNLEGQLGILTEEIRDDRAERRQLRVTAMTAQIEVDRAAAVTEIEIQRTGRLAALDERKERMAYRRQLALKIIGAVIAGGATLWGLISARC